MRREAASRSDRRHRSVRSDADPLRGKIAGRIALRIDDHVRARRQRSAAAANYCAAFIYAHVFAREELKTPTAINHFRPQKYWPVFVIVASFITTALLLRLEGRLWLCACGSIQLWSGQICSANNSQHFLDPYSFTHVLHGFLFFWLIAWLFSRLRPNWQLALAVAVEPHGAGSGRADASEVTHRSPRT